MSTSPEEKKKFGVRSKSLTVAQKAEAAAMWRTGSVTLDDLSKKYKKTPEMFSRLFTRMGVKKGEGIPALMKEAEKKIVEARVNDTEETLKRIAQVKDSHFKMSQQLAIMAFRDLQQARAAEIDIAKLKDAMTVYKLIGEIVGSSRRELFDILNVERHESLSEMDELPDLTVRELTQNEVLQLQKTPSEDDIDADLGEGMLDLEEDE